MREQGAQKTGSGREEQRMRKKQLMAAAAVLALGIFYAKPVMASQAGWNQDGIGSWYQYEDGSYARQKWEFIDSAWYYFDDNGYKMTGWHQEGPAYYYLGQDGAMWSERITAIDGKVYTIDQSGRCKVLPDYEGWIFSDQGWWYREKDGSYPTSEWKLLKDQWYHFNSSGYMDTGFLADGGKLYYLDEDGAMVHDESRLVNGINYSFDSSGSGRSDFKEPVRIPPEEEKSDLHKETDALADQILAGIVNDSMSQRQKAESIYRWIRGNIRYVSQPSGEDWVAGAHEGLIRRRGDCFTYYAVSVELLSRVGIPSIQVIRSTDNNHYWNLVCVDGNWYHFDTTPRSDGGSFCLLTDGQILAYSNAHRGSHQFDPSLYPPTP